MRITLLAAQLVLALLAVCPPPAATAADRPNVLFLFADDMRPDCIGALGNPAIKTPHLDELVGRGFAFTNAYCMGSTSGAVCNPSRHMTHSGKSLFRYDRNQQDGTWGDVMRKAGYATYHQSKRGNTAREYHKAFEETSYLDDGGARKSGHHGRAAADNAIRFLEKTWDRERPLFMYVGFAGPHDPRVAAPEWMDLYRREEIPLPANYRPFHPIDNGWMTGRDEKLAPWPRTEEVVRRHLHDYYGCISSIDHHVGRIVKKLEELGQLDNTLVVFSADHGLAIGSHGLFGKQNLYEHSMGAPLVFAGPDISHGKSGAFAYLLDIYPTACDLAGVKAPDGLDGVSQAPVIRGERPAVRDTIYLAFQQGQRAVRRGDWKLMRFPLVNHTLLFNLKGDPDELVNLAESAEHAAKVDELMGLLAAEQKRWDDPHPHTSESPGQARIELSFFENPPDLKKKSRKPKPEKSRNRKKAATP